MALATWEALVTIRPFTVRSPSFIAAVTCGRKVDRLGSRSVIMHGLLHIPANVHWLTLCSCRPKDCQRHREVKHFFSAGLTFARDVEGSELETKASTRCWSAEPSRGTSSLKRCGQG